MLERRFTAAQTTTTTTNESLEMETILTLWMLPSALHTPCLLWVHLLTANNMILQLLQRNEQETTFG